MIRVSARHLDLHALDHEEEIRILAGTTSVQIFSADHAGDISMNVSPTGSGDRWIEQDGAKNRWLNLTSLMPLRMYWLAAYRADPADRSSVVIHFRDITPGVSSPDRMMSGATRCR
jgi:hypothetical protein